MRLGSGYRDETHDVFRSFYGALNLLLGVRVLRRKRAFRDSQ